FDRAFARLPKRLTQGWQLQGITRLATGFPIQMSQGEGDASLTGSPSTDMPNLVGPLHIMNPRDTASTGAFTYFDQSAFALNECNLVNPTPTTAALTGSCGTFGTANRRFFHGPGMNNTDLGVTKTIPITERKAFEIRGEFFNIFNHAQFLNPSGDITSDTFGNVTNARAPRIGQVSAKFIW
ncbi:MAG: hypothetical protein ACM3ND_04995, partial [Acidobacteriota bacterium]